VLERHHSRAACAAALALLSLAFFVAALWW
jgi:hypothetical protein